MSVTKKNIVKRISEDLSINSKDSKKLFEKLLNIIKNEVNKNEVKISKFGTFYMKKTLQRVGRNPKTKESYIIYPALKISFRASKKIKEVLN